MAPPDPVARPRRPAIDRGHRLRIVNHDEFAAQVQTRQVPFAVGAKYLEGFRPPVERSAMQRIVEGFGYLEKILAAGEHLPLRAQIQLF